MAAEPQVSPAHTYPSASLRASWPKTEAKRAGSLLSTYTATLIPVCVCVCLLTHAPTSARALKPVVAQTFRIKNPISPYKRLALTHFLLLGIPSR